MGDEYEQTPPGIEPFSINMGNMEKLGLKIGEDITDIAEFKIFEKKGVIEDCEKNGFMSAWHTLRKKIESYEGEEIMIVADLECSYKEMCNFYWCGSKETLEEHKKKFASSMGADGKEAKSEKKKKMDEKLVKYIAMIRVTSDKKIDTLAHFATDGKEEEHKAVIEELVKNESKKIFDTRPHRHTEIEYCDYMAHGMKMDDTYEMESHLIVAGAFGKMFSRMAEPEFSLTIEKSFKYQAGIKADAVEAAIYHEFDEAMKEHFQKVAEQFEDEADDPDEEIPEFTEKILAAKREWAPVTPDALKEFDEVAKPDDVPKKRPQWVHHVPLVEEMRSQSTRSKQEFYLTKKRGDFAMYTMFDDFEDEKVAAFPRSEIKGYDFQQADIDIGFQCVSTVENAGTQTTWSRKVNKIVQVEPQRLTPKEIADKMTSKELEQFVLSKVHVCKRVLDSNDVVNLYEDEFECLAHIESSVGNKSGSNLKSMNQLRMNGMPPRVICDIDWHPTVKGMVAYACGANLDVDKEIELSGKVMWTSILMWNLNNLLSPRLRLVVPGDVRCFKINPENPYIIVGGMKTGQVIMWDLAASRIDGEDVYSNGTSVSNADEKVARVPSFSCKVTSVLQVSHMRAVTDLHWLPKGFRVSRRGELSIDNDAKAPQFFATVSGDGMMYFWDIKLKESHNADGSVDKNLRWGPTYKVSLMQDGAKMRLAATKFALLSGSENKTEFTFVTEAGEVSFGTWGKELDDDGKVKEMPVPTRSVYSAHCQHAVGVRQSPHFPDIVMTVGDWTFSLWKKGCDEPFFTSCPAESYLSMGVWSPTRPGVIITGRSDGVLDIWVLLDQIHKPVMHQVISANIEVSSIEFWSGKSSQQLLAVGDFLGTLHVYSVPKLLMKPVIREKKAMRAWYDHELNRQKYVKKRAEAAAVLLEKKKEEKKGEKKKKPEEKKGPSEDDLMEAREKVYQKFFEKMKEDLVPAEEKKKG